MVHGHEWIPCVGDKPYGRHLWEPDQRDFRKAWCALCGVCIEERNYKKAYKFREQATVRHGLCTVAAPLDEHSIQAIQSAADASGMRCSVQDVILLEGLLPQSVPYERGISSLQEKLNSCSGFRVKRVDVDPMHFPRRGETDIRIELQPQQQQQRVLRRLSRSPNCILPQDSIYVHVGYVAHNEKRPKVVRKQLRKLLQDKPLSLDPHGLKVVSPRIQGITPQLVISPTECRETEREAGTQCTATENIARTHEEEGVKREGRTPGISSSKTFSSDDSDSVFACIPHEDDVPIDFDFLLDI